MALAPGKSKSAERGLEYLEAKQIRSAWSAEAQKWYFSIIDVIEVLTGTDRPRKYWNDLKSKLQKEGRQLSENGCFRLRVTKTSNQIG